jgi:cation:H+ antiporter
VIEAAVVLVVLGIVIAGTQLPSSLDVLRVTPEDLLILVAWVAGLFLVQRAGKHLPWDRAGKAPEATPHTPGHRTRPGRKQATGTRMSTRRAALVFAAAAIATLVAGYVLEQSGDAASSQVGFSGILFGATVLALATSLPEISTGLQSVRQGDDNLAMSDIFGGNAFLPVLFLLAAVLSGKAVLPQANASDVYLTALAQLLTLIYLVGLIFRPRRRVLGMGVDSLAVLIVYLLGAAGLFAVAAAA